jgi:hypothetical protein
MFVKRVTRLEAGRDADRARLEAEISRFRAEAERAEMRLTRLLQAAQNLTSLPEQDDQ